MGEIYEHNGIVYIYSHKSNISGEMRYYYTIKQEENVESDS
jgi:hypothetical protein